MKKKFNILLVGFGYWGPILARNFQSSLIFNIYAICDSSKINLKKAKNIYPNTFFFSNYKKAIKNSNIDLVIISTPTNTHYKIAKYSLENKKHVVCEKPLCLKLNEVEKLISISKKNKTFLFVDYPFIYSESVNFIKDLINDKKLGKPLIYESLREKAPYRKDTNVVWDLGIHDIAILQYLTKQIPKEANLNIFKSKKKYKSDFANINLYYKNNFTAHLKMNWSSPIKIRLIKIYFEKGLLIYDENEDIYKVSIYKKSKLGYKHEFPLVYFNETLKLFVEYIGKTLMQNKFKNFDFNFSMNLTKTLIKITNNN
jgi:predicted dehydrogenase